MNKTLADLKNLQDIDDQLRLCKNIEAGAEERLRQARERLADFENEFKALISELEVKKKLLVNLESLAHDLQEKKKHNLNRQSNVKNNNEYQALEREAAHLSQSLSEAEDQILETMDFLEKSEIICHDRHQDLNEQQGQFKQLSDDIAAILADAGQNTASLLARRKNLIAAIEPLFLSQYEDLMKRCGGRAVGPASDSMCLSCSLGFPPQLYNELQKNTKISVCPNCSRILYWREHPDFKDE